MIQLGLFENKSCAFFQVSQKTRAMLFWSREYGIPIIKDPELIQGFKTILFSLLTWRDFYRLPKLYEFKGDTEWIAGGNAVYNPTAIVWAMDYIVVGDAFESFPHILLGARNVPGILNCKRPEKVPPASEPVFPCPISEREIIISTGCKRKCLFCINPWRRTYQEGRKEDVLHFIANAKHTGLALTSNSFDDVSFSMEAMRALVRCEKQNLAVSNSFAGLTDEFLEMHNHQGVIFVGVEGFSERLRKLIGKPIRQDEYREKIIKMLRAKRNTKLVYQFNLPTETMYDWEEFLEDMDYITAGVGFSSLAVTFIPHQTSPFTPLQWCAPHYRLEMLDTILAFRQKYGLSGYMNGVKLYVPQPLSSGKWFMQIVAEWMKIDQAMVTAMNRISEKNLSVPEMIEALLERGIDTAHIFNSKPEGFAFPWEEYVEYFFPKRRLFSIYQSSGIIEAGETHGRTSALREKRTEARQNSHR
jgi:radical SAM superfamily enzyme YgiQ (UPF0313 family)